MLFTILIFLLLLLVLVLVHEWGHFFAARKLGVKVEEFGFGFPPRAWSIQRGATRYSINWLPLGGFVKLKGESGELKGELDSFAAQKPWKRATILVAGVAMNLVLTFVLLTIGFASGLPTIVDEGNRSSARGVKVQFMDIYPSSPAAMAGLQPGDIILSLDGQLADSLEQVQRYTASHQGVAVTVELERVGARLSASVTPQVLPESSGRAVMGVTLVQTGIVTYQPLEAVWMGAKATGFLVYDIVAGFAQVVRNLLSNGRAGVEVAGPVGIAVLTGQVVHLGWIYVLQFAALLSANLAIINILPFPALDGGRLLFVVIEKVRRRATSEKIEAMVHHLGFMFLMLLVLLVTYQDVIRFSDRILGAFRRLWGM